VNPVDSVPEQVPDKIAQRKESIKITNCVSIRIFLFEKII